MVAGINMAKLINNEEMVDFSTLTATGGLSNYISGGSVGTFQPMNVTFGLIEPLGRKIRKKAEKNAAISERALLKITEIKEKCV